MAQMEKNPPVMQKTQVQYLGQEDPLEKNMATHSSFLAWRIPWTEEPGGPHSPWNCRVGHDWVTNITLILVISDVKHLFMCLLSSLEKYLLKSFAHFSIVLVCLFVVDLYELFVYFGD